ncbi:NAD(P)/FAD-dependent oxidoreductase [Dethiosulfatarculus sandiegensis]|uniref:FAD-dependent pyridine nucleotide-disulfide oxidoreductase n=1 Tax=Dethiosulfatarculus sandiegensis TaxID=1429043 RepID=A0A0D2J7J7_9BACT|nr:FAD-dependent oxidoreductase [Dethiosulfatarculus sandiegensis]KIX14189.1 FAD-dependent pyridine nucleotide-disulfide oxidoreductase [Dethiosulfatarculus sandiegensis]
MKKYLIIGNGVAGATAAGKIRSLDSEASITVISDETSPFYYRPRLPEFMAGEVDIKTITLRDQKWYEQKRIELLLGQTAKKIDINDKTVETDKGPSLPYDELLLATGAHPFIPPVPGADKENVFSLRTVEDARKIAKAAGETDAVILLGGGLLGLETGAALVRMGLKPVIVEMFDRLLPRQLDPTGAKLLQKRLGKMGFEFHLGTAAQEITGKDKANGVLLKNGTSLEGGFVVFSAGIRGNIELAKQAGLDIQNGLVVDDRMQTSLPNIWAAGDQVEHAGRLYGIWQASQAQGEVAGENMAGGDAKYTGTVMSNSLKVVGVDLFSAGDIDPEDEKKSAVYLDDNSYRKIVFDQGAITGAIFYGLTKGVMEVKSAMSTGTQGLRFLDDMKNKDFNFKRLQ